MENGKNPKVSIIVPMYNVGGYADSCLRSLMSQTYNNLEIIVVNDGSTDETPVICNDAVAADSRARVIDKENGGLSSARNYGLAYATGDFVMFVDGDDLLDRWAIGHLVALAQETGAKLVTCGFKKIRTVGEFDDNEASSFKMVSGEELLEMMLLLKGESGSACAKLYSKELVPLLEFPEGQLFEDFGVVAKVLSSVESVCVTDAELYGYVTREESITTAQRYGDAHLEGMKKSLNVVNKVVGDIPSLTDARKCFEAFCSLRVASKLDIARCSNRLDALCYIAHSRKLCSEIALSPLPSRTWRIRCALFSLSPALHNVVYYLYGKLTGKVIA